MTLCCLSRGKRPTCSPVKFNLAQDIEFEKDVYISCTEKDVPVYVFRGVVHSRETEMSQISVETVGTEEVDIFVLSSSFRGVYLWPAF